MSLIFKLQKKKILRILIKVFVFLSGTVLLIVQIHGTIGTFIKKRTSTGFAISKKISKSIIPPTIIFCPKHKWTFMHENISNKELYFDQFNWLNDKLNLSIERMTSHVKTTDYGTSSKIGVPYAGDVPYVGVPYGSGPLYKKLVTNLTLGHNFDDETGKVFDRKNKPLMSLP